MTTNDPASPRTPAIPTLKQVPEELRDLDQWLMWKYQKADKGKVTKVPFSPITLGQCSAAPKHSDRWGTAEQAIAAARKHQFDGIGFVFTDNDPYVGIDFDAAIDPETGRVMEWAEDLLKKTCSYTEFSVSKTGKHVLCAGETALPGTKANVPDAPQIQGKGPQVEIYFSGRYFVFTGEVSANHPIVEDQQFINLVENTLQDWKSAAGKKKARVSKQSASIPDDLFDLSFEPLGAEDQRLVDDLLAWNKVFRDLWNGDLTRYDNDASKADFALCKELLERTGKDIKRTVRVFTASALGQRDKWRDRLDYRQRTVGAAHEACPVAGIFALDADEVEAAELSGPPFEIVRDGKTEKIGTVYEPFFARLYTRKNNIIWSLSEKQPFLYSEKIGIYEPVDPAIISESISGMLLSAHKRDWTKMGITDASALLRTRTSRKLDGIVQQVVGMTGEYDPFQPGDEMRAHLANGVLIHKGCGEFVVEEFSPRFRSRNASPIFYEPGAEAPRFLSMMRRGLRDEQEIELILAYIGQCIFGRNLMQRMLIMTGPSDNGKSTFSKLIQELVGKKNRVELKPNKLEASFEQARLIHRTLLTGSDVKGNFLSGEGAQRLKAIVGGDYLSPEQKNSNQVLEIKGTFNVWVFTNEKLTVAINDDADAWVRRLLPFFYDAPRPEKKIRDYERLLLDEEGSGILNLAVGAFGRLIKQFDETGEIVLPPAMQNRIQSFLPESERLRAFLKECLCTQKGSHLPKEEILDRYVEFAAQRGWEASTSQTMRTHLKTLLKETFGLSESHSVHDDDDDEVRGYRGLAFKEEQA